MTVSVPVEGDTLILSADFFGEEAPRQGNTVHSHFYYELFYAPREAMCLFTPEGTVRIPPDCAALVAPNVPHTLTGVSAAYMALAFRFRGGNPNGPLAAALETTFSARRWTVLPPDEVLTEILLGLRRYALGRYPDREQLFRARSCELIYYLRACLESAEQKTEVGPAEDLRFRLDSYLCGHLTDPHLSLQSVAEGVFLSESQVNRLIQAQTGRSFRQSVIALRMENAARLLEQTVQSVGDIACAVGYASVQGFYSAFRKTFHRTPEDYRRAFRRPDGDH